MPGLAPVGTNGTKTSDGAKVAAVGIGSEPSPSMTSSKDGVSPSYVHESVSTSNWSRYFPLPNPTVETRLI